jgi:hypothetical protein
MSVNKMFAVVMAAMLIGCGSSSPTEEVDDDAGPGEFSSKPLPATVVGVIDMSLGEGNDPDQGEPEMLYGSLLVGKEDLYIQADAAMLESSGIEQEPTKVRATIQSKEDLGHGMIHYKVISVDKL